VKETSDPPLASIGVARTPLPPSHQIVDVEGHLFRTELEIVSLSIDRVRNHAGVESESTETTRGLTRQPDESLTQLDGVRPIRLLLLRYRIELLPRDPRRLDPFARAQRVQRDVVRLGLDPRRSPTPPSIVAAHRTSLRYLFIIHVCREGMAKPMTELAKDGLSTSTSSAPHDTASGDIDHLRRSNVGEKQYLTSDESETDPEST